MAQAKPQLNLAADNDSDAQYREPPHNEEAEKLVLGAILTDNEAMNRVGDFLTSQHFYLPVHQRIFDAILRFQDRGMIASPVTLKNQFDKDEALDELGGAAYLAEIAGMASTILDVKAHASVVYSLAVSRELIHIGTDMVNLAHESNGEKRASEQIEISEHKLFSLASQGNSETSFQHLKGSLTEAIELANAASKRKGAISGLPTGFIDLDRLLGGMHNSDLMILAARPSMGKTALALNLALNAAEQSVIEFEEKKAKGELHEGDDKPVSIGVISLEMSSEQLATRLLSIKTGINAGNIRRGKLEKSKHNDEFAKLVQASQELHELPVFLDDTPALSIAAIRTRARRLKRKHNLGLLVIDYLQLIHGVGQQSQANRVQEVSEITMGLKAIAKELNIPVLALSQLSRQVESRDDKRPQLADLRESGSIEQDADMVMFIYREAYYLERKKPQEGTEKFDEWMASMEHVNNLAEIMVAKNRNGPIDNVVLFFDKTTTRFGNFERGDMAPDSHI